jgi:membrane protein DedA with SNARE-associated domain
MTAATVIALFLHYKYPVLIVLAFIEGPYVMMMSGFLIKLGVLALIPTYAALSFGDLMGDMAWYGVGYFFGNRFVGRFGKFFDITKENVESAKELFSKHRKKILLGSKVTAGFGLSLATLVTAGMAEAPFGEFVLLNFCGQFVWTGVMLSVGYFFGNLYIVINNIFGRIFIIAAALIVLYFILRLSRHFGRRAKSNLTDKS